MEATIGSVTETPSSLTETPKVAWPIPQMKPNTKAGSISRKVSEVNNSLGRLTINNIKRVGKMHKDPTEKTSQVFSHRQRRLY
jgi:hypothetical protein